MKHWARRISFAALSCLCAAGLALLYGFTVEPDRLVVRRVELALPGWPAARPPLKIAVFSDLHAGSPYIDVDKIRQVVALANAEKPDLILLPGDFVIDGVRGGRFMEPVQIASELSHLAAAHGVYAVLGNHDAWNGRDKVWQAFEAVGIRMLENEAVRIEVGGGALWLAGLADAWTGHPDIAATLRQVTDDSPVIAFAHNPDIFPTMPSRVALTVAGHTHGGQVVLPLIGRPIVPSRYGQRYAIGHIVEDGRHLFVTPGVGTSIVAVRFGVPPEISILTIKSRG